MSAAAYIGNYEVVLTEHGINWELLGGVDWSISDKPSSQLLLNAVACTPAVMINVCDGVVAAMGRGPV